MSPAKDTDGGWKTFVWNSEKSEFLGRTGSSWLKIFLFYLIFYGCLAGIFIGTIQALLLTLSDYTPTYQDRVAPPGLSHTPRSEKSEISFTVGKADTYKKYHSAMEEFLAPYNTINQEDDNKFENCGDQPAGVNMRGGELAKDQSMRKACRFERSWLGPCSGLYNDSTYGFGNAQPCLLVKLNRIINFIPKPKSVNVSVPLPVRNRMQPNLIPIHCTNKREGEEDLIGKIEYHGVGGGFPLQYYPYYGKKVHEQYLQPLVAVQFLNVTKNKEVRIECRVYGENLHTSEKDRYQGRFDVKFTIQDV